MNGAQKDIGADDGPDFGTERVGEAQLSLRYILGRLAGDAPYEGVFEVLGKPPLIVDNHEIVGEWYMQALADFCVHEGGKLGVLEDRGDQVLVYPKDEDSTGFEAAPVEKLRIAATLPPQLATNTEAICGAIAACSECVRILLAGGISAACEDREEGEAVRVMHRNGDKPKVAVHRDLKTGTCVVGVEFAANVYTEREPRVSYLLGSVVGASPRLLNYILPLVSMVYGPNRLHWMDQRSPDAQRHLKIVGGAG